MYLIISPSFYVLKTSSDSVSDTTQEEIPNLILVNLTVLAINRWRGQRTKEIIVSGQLISTDQSPGNGI